MEKLLRKPENSIPT